MLKTILNLLKILLVVIGAALCIFLISGQEVMGDESEQVGYALQWSYFCLALCGGAAILFTLYHFIMNFRRSISALIGFAIFAGILGISYSSASEKVLPGWDEEVATSTVSQLVGGGMISVYVLLALAVFTIVVTEVYRLVR